MSKGGKTGGGPQPSAPGILPGGGPLTSSSPGKGGRGMPPQQQEPSGWGQPPAQQFGGVYRPGGMGDEYGFGYNPNRPSGPGKGGRQQPDYGDPAFGSGSSGRAGPWDSDYYTRDISNQGGWGQPQFQGGFGGYGQGSQRPSGPGKGGPFQGPGPSYNQPQMPFGYGQMQYSPQRFHGYGVPSSIAQPFPDVRSPSPGYPQPPPDIQLPPPGYPQQLGMGGPGKGGRRRGPPPYMGGRGPGGPGYDPRAGAGPSPQERHQAALTRARRLSTLGGGGGPGKGGRGRHQQVSDHMARGPNELRQEEYGPAYSGGGHTAGDTLLGSPEYQELLAERQRSRGQNEGVNERLRIMQQQQQRQREEYGPVGGYAQMLRKLGRPGGQYTPSQADEPFWTSAYSGGGGIAGIYGPGGRVR